MSDHRSRPRRRGEALNSAIYEAALDELAEVGYAKLTMERVAERAGASKASVYRRWPSRMQLALDAVHHAAPDPGSPPDTGLLRDDLLGWLRRAAGLLAGPAGEALRGLVGDALSDPARTRALREHSHGNGRRAMQEIARRAVDRGELRPEALTPRRLDVAQALLRHHFLFHDPPIPDEVVVEIVDEVVLPLLHTSVPPRPAAAPPPRSS